MPSTMRVLILTKIFPNRYDPSYASYNRHQFRELSRLCRVQLLALWPDYPGAARVERWRGRVRRRPPAHDIIDGMTVEHPRVLYVPKVGAPLAGASYLLSLLPRLLPRRDDFDIVMGSFAFPDGWAAVALAKLLGKPSLVKLHGSDVNVVSQQPLLLPGLRFTLRNAGRVVANNQTILDKAVALGTDPGRVRLVPNGVDGEVFHPRSKAAARASLGLPESGQRVLYVGRLVATKGLWELLDAAGRLASTHPALHFDLVGDGQAASALKAAAEERGLPLTFHGDCTADEVACRIAAADVVTLPSYAEGMPNAVVEALACGRPVVATDVGGIPTLLTEACQGEMVPVRDASALAAALARVVAANYPGELVASARKFPSWSDSANMLHRALVEAS